MNKAGLQSDITNLLKFNIRAQLKIYILTKTQRDRIESR